MKALAPAWAARLGEDHVLELGALAAISDTALTREVAIAIGESGAADDVRARPQSHLPRLRRRTRLSAWSQASRRRHVRDRLPRRYDQGHATGAQPGDGAPLRDPYAADVDRQGRDLRAGARDRRRRVARRAGRGYPHLLSGRPLAAT